jgi:hypothetical protein
MARAQFLSKFLPLFLAATGCQTTESAPGPQSDATSDALGDAPRGDAPGDAPRGDAPESDAPAPDAPGDAARADAPESDAPLPTPQCGSFDPLDGGCPEACAIGYVSPGCGASAAPKCLGPVQDACAIVVCACGGGTELGCDYFPEPYMSDASCSGD